MSSSAKTTGSDFLRYQRAVGLSVMQGRGYYYPVDSAIDQEGNLHVLSRALDIDTRGIRVTVSDEDDEFLGTYGRFGEGEGQFIWPTAIAVDSRGVIYVSDENTNLISVFDTSRKFLQRWGRPGSDPGELDGPSGLALDADDNLFVVDHQNSRVQKFTGDGRFLSSFGSEGTGNGQFNMPWGVAVGAGGEVYVADWRNDRVQKFSADGEFLAKYGSPGDGDGQFHRPSSVAVDEDGYIYVADWGNERVQVLDANGGFVTKLRGESTISKWAQEFLTINVEEADARAMSDLAKDINFFVDDPHEESSHIEKYFWGPVSVTLDRQGALYVTETNRHRVQIFKRV